MSLQILDPGQTPSPDGWYDNYCHEHWFMTNGQSYQYHTDPETFSPVDILLSNRMWDIDPEHRRYLESRYQAKIRVNLDIYRNFANQIEHHHNLDRYETVTLVNAHDSTINNETIIFSDALFNRTKSYYEKFPYGATWLHHFSDHINYVVPTPVSPDQKTKIFVSASTTSRDPRPFRARIVEVIKNKYQSLGHFGHGDTDINHVLCYNAQCPNATCIGELDNVAPRLLGSLGYAPPHNLYYQDTFLSVYSETIEHGSTLSVTEKTFDPLIKGHFILPFSAAGFVAYLEKQYDFIMPDFIDYGYDQVHDDHMRFSYYQNELERLLSLPISTWRNLWADNYHIIEHNKSIFDRPYHSVDLHAIIKRFG
jgi:hypothetical protein